MIDKRKYSKLKFTVSYYLIIIKEIFRWLSYNFSALVISPTDLFFLEIINKLNHEDITYIREI